MNADDNGHTVQDYTTSEVVDTAESPERNTCTGSDEDEEDVRGTIPGDITVICLLTNAFLLNINQTGGSR